MECGPVGEGGFVGAPGRAAPLFAAVHATFDGVPLLGGLGAESALSNFFRVAAWVGET